MSLSVILEDKLATDGIEYSYTYLLEGNYQPDRKSLESWKVVDVRRLQDNDSNSLEEYQKYIDLTFEAIKDHGKAVICCSYGISRSNAIAIRVLVKYYGMTFSQAQELVNQEVKKSDIVEAYIVKLRNLLIKE